MNLLCNNSIEICTWTLEAVFESNEEPYVVRESSDGEESSEIFLKTRNPIQMMMNLKETRDLSYQKI